MRVALTPRSCGLAITLQAVQTTAPGVDRRRRRAHRRDCGKSWPSYTALSMATLLAARRDHDGDVARLKPVCEMAMWARTEASRPGPSRG